MGLGGIANDPTIPAYMASLAVKSALVADNGQPATIGAAKSYFQSTNADIMAGFSSQGPTDVDFRVKPDVVAPGVNVLSSIPAAFCAAPPCFAFFQGTSMATPHLAGSAAVVRQQHPAWSAAEVRSAIVNTADRGVLRSFSTGALQDVVNITGSGRENLLKAVGARAALDPVSVSFGAVPSGGGQTKTFDVIVHNLGAGTVTWTVVVSAGDASVAYSVSPGTVTLAPDASTVVTVSMTAGQGAAPGFHQGLLEVKGGSASLAHAAVFTLIK
jgi:minor extracellular serine protease Vpr